VSQPVVSDYERGGLRLHGELILRVAEILDVSANELLGWTRKQRRRNAARNLNWKSKWPPSPPCRARNNGSFWLWSKPSSHSTPRSEKSPHGAELTFLRSVLTLVSARPAMDLTK